MQFLFTRSTINLQQRDH